jgi:hypothetical protein
LVDLTKLDEQYLRARERALRKHSSQIGRLCVLWSGLEWDLTLLLAALSAVEDPTSKNVLLGSMDMREKIPAVLALAFKRQRSERWFDSLSTLLNAIWNELRPERNRMVHDFWMIVPTEANPSQIQRVQFKPSVINTQSRTKQLKLAKSKAVTPEEIASLCDRVFETNLSLNKLRHEYEQTPLLRRLPLPIPSRNPSQGQTE